MVHTGAVPLGSHRKRSWGARCAALQVSTVGSHTTSPLYQVPTCSIIRGAQRIGQPGHHGVNGRVRGGGVGREEGRVLADAGAIF